MRLRLFDGDDAVLADLLHRFGDDPADGLVVVRRDRADLRDHRSGHRLGHLLELAVIASTAFSMPRLIAIGLAPAVTFFAPSR